MSAWRKLGRVVAASGDELSVTHAMLPTPLLMKDRVRVFFASCDAALRGRVFYADFAPEPPFRLIGRSRHPVLDVGPNDAFDCDGANPSQAIVTEDGRLALLYIGWRRGPAHAPYTLLAALALSDDDGVHFERPTAPLLAPSPGERLFRTAPFLERRPEGVTLLYIGGDAFLPAQDGRLVPTYSLMALGGPRLGDWRGPAQRLLEPDAAAGEVGFGRPILYSRQGERRLMISVRGKSGYRLVEAPWPLSPNLAPAFEPVVAGPLADWERDMTCFGAVCDVGPNQLLFYNGDGYGRTGFGLAWRPRG